MPDPRISIDHVRGVVSILAPRNITILGALKKILPESSFSYDPGYGFRIMLKDLPLLEAASKTWGLTREDSDMLLEASKIPHESRPEPVVKARPSRSRPWQVEVYLSRETLDSDIPGKAVAAVDSSFTSQDPRLQPARQFFKDDQSGIFGWRLVGSLSEYYRMLTALESRGVNTDTVRSIIENLAARGVVSQGREEGALEGFREFDEFKSGVEEFQNRFFEGKNIPADRRRFAPEQVRGMAFLYGNSSALLGDDVGVGKTVQTVVAAEMRRRQSGGSVLFITQPILVDQIKDEIEKITGLDDAQVSTSYNTNSPYRVLSYNLFGTPGTREDATRLLSDQAKNGVIKIMVLDEVHNVKNGDPSKRDDSGGLKHKDSHQTFNIQEIAKHVPFVWGASATIIGNTPVDIYNQLKAVNHPLGRMPFQEFRLRFDPRSGSIDERLMSADELKERLIHSGVYLQRSKEQIRPDMPPLRIDSRIVDLDAAPMPANATQQRQAIASAKAPHTVAMMMEFIRRGEKVAAFTSFKNALAEIKGGIERAMEQDGIAGRVASIEGSQPDRKDVIRDFRNPASDYRAIVISTPAGGTGLDFPNILTQVFVNDFDWSVAKDTQSLGRFHRINSQEPVNVTYMVASGADSDNFERLNAKKQVADRLRALDQEEVNLLHSGIDGSDERVKQLRRERLQLNQEIENLDRA